MRNTRLSQFAAIVGVVCSTALSLSTLAQTKVTVDPKLPEYKAAQGVSGTLKSMGSDTLVNVATQWGDDFKKLYPGVKVEVEGKGSGSAPTGLIENQAQFGAMSRPMKDTEIGAFEKKFGYKPTQLRTAIDTLAIFVHKDNPLEEITLEQAKKLFSVSGPTMTWGDLGVKGDLAGQPVSLYGRNSTSGTYTYFKEHALKNTDYKNTVKEQPGSAGVVQAVGADKAGIGYSGVGYMTAEVKVLKIKKENGKAVTASYETALSGEYPLARFLYMYVNKDPNASIDPLRAEFIKMIFSKQGQEAVIKDGYYPVPAKVAAEDLKKTGL